MMDSEQGCRRIPSSGGAGWLAWMAWWYFDSTSFPYHSVTQKVVSIFSIRYLSYGKDPTSAKKASPFLRRLLFINYQFLEIA